MYIFSQSIQVPMTYKSLIAFGVVLTLAAPAQAQEFIASLSGWDLRSGANAALLLEVHGKPRWDYGWVQLGLGAAVGADTEGSAWIGGGVVAEAPLSNHWFVEASVMPGYYHPGTPQADLGSDFEVRSLLGLGYRFDNGNALSVAAGHLSNASISNLNPGANGILLRYHRSF